ncbi:MAG TPA: tetratricopeptide repeat protein [Candidatus Eisenbacteria bacterium]|nr:tetratricopeptide repeat protein [Candidatus Eisenbacteria bacterium]
MSVETERSESQLDQHFSLREAARIVGVPEARLRALARGGFVASQRGPIGPLSFGFRDLLLLRTTKGLLESGVPMRRIRRIWASLRGQLDSDIPLTSISIHTDGQEVVATEGNDRWRPDSGQFLLNFDASEIADRAEERLRLVVSDETRPPEATYDTEPTAEDWYETGCDLEATSPEEAREAYERALELDSGVTDAHINLGRLLHMAGELGRAEPHYREAAMIDPDDPTPHFNLGVLLEEVGRKDEAVHAYRQAILRDPDFADAHCNLGLLLESLARRHEAVFHLMAARNLNGSPE